MSQEAGVPSFSQVYEDHVWDVYGFLGYRVRSREEAEDLTQATFERALKAWSRFDPEKSSAKTWLLAIAHNLMVDHFRRPGSTRETLTDDPALYDNRVVSSQPDLGIDPDLEAALGRLGNRERELVALRFGADMKGPEIAELTGLALTNVHQILSRALRKLRDSLGSERQEFTEQAGQFPGRQLRQPKADSR